LTLLRPFIEVQRKDGVWLSVLRITLPDTATRERSTSTDFSRRLSPTGLAIFRK
jgi:hypothetical protein